MSDTTTTASTPNPGEGATTTTAAASPQGTTATAQTTPEGTGQTEGGTKPEGDKPAGAPEAYEAFKLPEGVTLEGERLETAHTTFKSLGLSQEQSQGLLDLYVKLQGEDAGAITQLLEDQRIQQTEQWGAESKQQLGAKYDETVALARTAVQHANDPELVKAFDTQGWGNHPALIKAFAKFGSFLRDSNVEGLGGGTAVTGEKSIAERMYPGMTK